MPPAKPRRQEKKLAGAALTSFMKKCEADAAGASSCDAMAAEKKLAGAAKTSYVTKCEKDAAGGSKAAAACDAQAGREEARRRGQDQLREEVRRRDGEARPLKATSARPSAKPRA